MVQNLAIDKIDPFFSIIIPVFNGINNGLDKCLNSIWKQQLDHSLYEVICIDDCSTDNTWEYLQEQSLLHSNLRIFKNGSNLRQGATRNIGVRKALGKYILFLDSDDYYHPESLLKVLTHLSKNKIDVLVNDSTYQFGDIEHNKLQLNFKYTEVTDGETFLLKNWYACAPWRLTIKRSFFLQNDLFFVEGNRVEDIDWGLKVFYYAKQIQYFPHILVHYVKGDTGTSDNMYRDLNTICDNINAGTRTYELADTLYKESVARNIIIRIACSYYHTSVCYLFGIWTSVNKKREIINMIPEIPENSKIVKIAQKVPTIFSAVSNLCVPLFRIARTIRRRRMAKMLQVNAS